MGTGRGGSWIVSCEGGSAGGGSSGAIVAGICAGEVSVVGGRRRCVALGCVWARVDDVSKSRRQELAGLPRDVCPLEGHCYARSGVTLAPTLLFGAEACQSWTIRT